MAHTRQHQYGSDVFAMTPYPDQVRITIPATEADENSPKFVVEWHDEPQTLPQIICSIRGLILRKSERFGHSVSEGHDIFQGGVLELLRQLKKNPNWLKTMPNKKLVSWAFNKGRNDRRLRDSVYNTRHSTQADRCGKWLEVNVGDIENPDQGYIAREINGEVQAPHSGQSKKSDMRMDLEKAITVAKQRYLLLHADDKEAPKRLEAALRAMQRVAGSVDKQSHINRNKATLDELFKYMREELSEYRPQREITAADYQNPVYADALTGAMPDTADDYRFSAYFAASCPSIQPKWAFTLYSKKRVWATSLEWNWMKQRYVYRINSRIRYLQHHS